MKYTLKTITFRAAEPTGTPLDGPAAALRVLHDLLEEQLDQGTTSPSRAGQLRGIEGRDRPGSHEFVREGDDVTS